MKVLICTILLFNCCLSQLNAKIIQVMSYNVENLFDAKHDTKPSTTGMIDKRDWAYLPKDTLGKKEACQNEKSNKHKKECMSADWTENKLNQKIANIVEVVTKERVLPDFLGLVEVENKNVVGLLAKKLGYSNFEVTDSPDARGIDVALLYRHTKYIKKISMKEHIVPVDYATRNILEVEFLIAGKYPLTIFVNHWPSLANPDSWRIQAAEILHKRSIEILKLHPKMAILSMGDFNTINESSPHPFNTVLFRDKLFIDVEDAFLKDAKISDKQKTQKALGTYYFAPKDQWNSLDHFFINKNLLNGKELEILIPSFEIYNAPFLTHELHRKMNGNGEKNIKFIMAPKRFNPRAKSLDKIGYSDHFPILVKLKFPDVRVGKKKILN